MTTLCHVGAVLFMSSTSLQVDLKSHHIREVLTAGGGGAAVAGEAAQVRQLDVVNNVSLLPALVKRAGGALPLSGLVSWFGHLERNYEFKNLSVK